MSEATDIGSISWDDLTDLLEYNPETGIFTAKVTRADLVAGQIAGYLHKPSGYWLITINWKKYKAHRLAWFYMFGRWPEEELDHIDKNRSHNPIDNLRPCSHSQNQMNSKTRVDNTSGYRGVYFDIRTNKWRAYLTINGKRIYFGRHSDIEDAFKARRLAEADYFGGFASNA